MDYSRALAEIRAAQLRQKAQTQLRAPFTPPKEEWPPSYEAVLGWREQQLALFKSDPRMIVAAKAWYKQTEHCIDFINHWCDTFDPRNVGKKGKMTRMPFILFPRQEELVLFILALLAEDGRGLVEKARDMGATWVCAAVCVWLWLFHPGTALGWGSNKLEKVDILNNPDSVMEKIRMLIKWLPKELLPRGLNFKEHLLHKKIINPENGAIISADGGLDIGRGGRTLAYFVDEAAHLEHPEAAEAALSENTRVRIDVSSVSPPGTVFHRTREAGVEWAPGGAIVKNRANVFLMGWDAHPAKDEEWYRNRKEYYESNGLLSVFEREVNRNYAGAQEGALIRIEWVKAARNAHKLFPQLGIDESGGAFAGLDIADGGLDRNALSARKGMVLKTSQEWGDRDTGVTARRAINLCIPFARENRLYLNYDSTPIGSGVKAETNRLKDDKLMPKNIVMVPWNAGSAVLDPLKRVVIKTDGTEDKESLRNKDLFANLKAQGWWNVARLFENTYRAVEAIKRGQTPPPYRAEQMISIDVEAVTELQYAKLEKQLCQAVAVSNTRLKMMIDKAPEGVASPDMADSLIMCYWPWRAPQPLAATVGPLIVRA